MHQEKLLKMKNKRAQEEIVGFVIIVIIVVMAGVIILGMVIRSSNSSNLESKEIYYFLESSMQITTSCAISYEPAYLRLSELIEKCYSSLNNCLSGENPCEVLNRTIKEVIESSFNIDNKASIKGYEFKSVYMTNITLEEIYRLEKGECVNNIKGSELIIPAFPGSISNTLKLCY